MITTKAREVFPPLMLVFLLAALSTQAAEAQPPSKQEPSEEELAKQTQNPVADLISVPFQNNFNFGTGSKNRTVWILNIQPVIPIKLGDEWNLITRTIMPVINQPSLFPGMSSATGLGDINPTFFFSPAKSGELIWGVGPTFTLPTATDSLIGSGKFSMGPAAVALTIQGHWVFGALANNQWSVAGWGKQNVNAFLLQPFLNYNLPDGWYLLTAPIMTANWAAAKAAMFGPSRLEAESANSSGWVKYFHWRAILLRSSRSTRSSRRLATFIVRSLVLTGNCASKSSCCFRSRRSVEGRVTSSN